MDKQCEKDIFTEIGDRIKWYEKTPYNFIDRTTLIFGGSNTGKTTLVEEILYMVKEFIPNYIVIVPENSSETYKRKFPPQCIKEDLTKELFAKIWKRQEWAQQIYKVANDPSVLRSLFEKINNYKARKIIEELERRANIQKQHIEFHKGLDYGQKKMQMCNIDTQKNKQIIQIYKTTIRVFRYKINENNLNNRELTAFKFLDFNPRLMLIVDDCTDKMERWMKMYKKTEDNVFQNVFFRGRHNAISMIIIAHNDKVLDTTIRNGATITMFSEYKAVMNYIGRKGNSLSKEENNQLLRIASKIYSPLKNGADNHQKLVYVRSDNAFPFQYTIADIYPDFRIGCSALYKFINKVKKEDDRSLEENPFLKGITQRD